MRAKPGHISLDGQLGAGLEDGEDVLLDLAGQQLEQVGVPVGQLEVPAHVGDQHHGRERGGNWKEFISRQETGLVHLWHKRAGD